jgi:hypothetical protein
VLLRVSFNEVSRETTLQRICMPKLQDVLDKVLPAFGVVVTGDFLREPGVSAFFDVLKYREFHSGKNAATVREEIKSCASYTIWCSIADDQLSFGPTLTIQGDGEPGKITIPWHQITAIVQLHEPYKVPPMGFARSVTKG